jgi:peptidoglycan/LPS O-acetylase OafA/YrhL
MENRDNNFNALRFWAATAVVWAHSYPLSAGQPDPLDVLTGHQADIGAIAVAAFFAISGYLITQSYQRTQSPIRYSWARSLRIFPALIVVLFLTAFLLGPVVTQLPLREYFSDRHTYTYILKNIPVFQNQYNLPGVFAENPYPDSVNGSLWTLPPEFRCYVIILAIGMLSLLRVSVILTTMALAIIAGKLAGTEWRLTLCFLSGSLFLLSGARPSKALSGICAVVLVGSIFVGMFKLALATAGAYLVLSCGLAGFKIPYPSRYGDLSYGIYIYAFPVQQTLAHLLGPVPWIIGLAISLPIIFVLAGLSWRLIEAPALKLKFMAKPSFVRA